MFLNATLHRIVSEVPFSAVMRPGNNVQTSRCQRAAEFRVSLGATSFVMRVLSRMARQKSGSMCLSKNKLGHAYSLMRVGL